jgi:CTP:molybdopterin cytidylyltransferase MocA
MGEDVAGWAAVVLAAGAGSRFGGGKLLAELEGRPMLQHVLESLRELEPRCCVVVLGTDAARIEARVVWRDEVRVVNPAPDTGLAGSLRLGVAACLERAPDAAGVLVALGDQPRTSPMVIRALVAAVPDARRASAWAVVPAYAGGGGANPALLLPLGLRWVPRSEGDQGMGAVLAAEPGRAYRVPVSGTNPDVDTPADLVALAEAEPPTSRPG